MLEQEKKDTKALWLKNYELTRKELEKYISEFYSIPLEKRPKRTNFLEGKEVKYKYGK